MHKRKFWRKKNKSFWTCKMYKIYQNKKHWKPNVQFLYLPTKPKTSSESWEALEEKSLKILSVIEILIFLMMLVKVVKTWGWLWRNDDIGKDKVSNCAQGEDTGESNQRWRPVRSRWQNLTMMLIPYQWW